MANGLAIAGGENFWTASAGALSPSAAQGYNDVNLVSAGLYRWNLDTTLARLAAASMRQGGAPSATPVAQTFTLGEASRPGTDANVGGASGTFRPGLGTGTGTASSLVFQTPTLAASGTGTQAYATRMTIATTGVTTTVQMFGPSGSQAAPDYSFTGSTNSGMSMFSTTFLFFSVANTTPGGWQTDTLLLSNNVGLTWVSGANASGTLDTCLARLAAASVRQGLAPSATPVAQTFTIGEASRNATDSNVGGSSGTLRSGLGTGTGTASSLIFQTPTLTGSGTVAQTYGTRMTVATDAVTLTIPLLFSADNTHDIGAAGATRARDLYLGRDLYIGGANAAGSLRFSTTQQNGAAAASGTLTNAPAAGNPTKWIPVDDAGTTRYIPAW